VNFGLDGLTIRHKLAVLCSTFLLPIGFLTYLFIAQTQKDVAIASAELQGSRYISALRGELAAAIAAWNGTASSDDLARAQAAVRQLDAEQATAMNAETAAAWAAKAVDAVRQRFDDRDAALFDAAIDAVLDHIGKVQDGSGLTLDPDLDSYYAQDLATVKTPVLVVSASRALDAALPHAAADHPGPEMTALLLTRKGAFRTAVTGLRADLAAGQRGNRDGTMRPALDPPFRALAAQSEHYLGLLDALTAPGRVKPAATELRSAHAAVQQAAAGFWAAALDELDHLIEARIIGLNIRLSWSLALTAIVFLGSVALAWRVAGSIGDPLFRLHQTMHALASGNTGVEIPDTGRGDELGVMARDVEIFKQDAIELASLVDQVLASARRMALTTSQVAAAVKQSTNAIAAVSRSTQTAQGLSAAVAAQVGESRERMHAMADVVRGTAENAVQVERMAASISEIADQTHMLALNAAIEAARAGEQQRGFSVVAEEVRKLAENSGRLAQAIGAVVRSATEESQKAVAIVGEVGDGMEVVADKVGQSDMLAASVAAAIEQQQASAVQIGKNLEELAGIAQSNAAAAEEISSAMNRPFGEQSVSVAAGGTARWPRLRLIGRAR
jgi:methyl-accepting chemotaxis protein